MAGTASTVRSFLLVEHSGPWGEEALRDARMPKGIGPELRERAAATAHEGAADPAAQEGRTHPRGSQGLRGVRPPRRALARDHRPRRPARRPRPRPRGARRRPVARPDPALRTRARRLHPWPTRQVLCRARPPGRGRAGRGVPRGDLGGEPHRRRPLRRQPAGPPARPLLRAPRPGLGAAVWPGCSRPASSTSTTCAAGPGWPCRCRRRRRHCAGMSTSAGSTPSGSSPARSTAIAPTLSSTSPVAGTSCASTTSRGSDLQRLTCAALRENPVMHHVVDEIRAV